MSETEVITVQELVNRIRVARDRCGQHNPNRRLWAQCEIALMQLADRVAEQASSGAKETT